MDAPDDVIHQPIRLRVMAALSACDPSDEGLDFAHLKKLTGATDGNLGRISITWRAPVMSK